MEYADDMPLNVWTIQRHSGDLTQWHHKQVTLEQSIQEICNLHLDAA